MDFSVLIRTSVQKFAELLQAALEDRWSLFTFPVKHRANHNDWEVLIQDDVEPLQREKILQWAYGFHACCRAHVTL